jgi:hypothetical protein
MGEEGRGDEGSSGTRHEDDRVTIVRACQSGTRDLTMNRLRPFATLLLVTAFAVFQLLATAPLLHPHCNLLGSLTLQGPATPALNTPGGATTGNTDECPVCMVSGLSAVLSPGLSVFAPSAHVAVPLLPAYAAVRALPGEGLRSRAPPAL